MHIYGRSMIFQMKKMKKTNLFCLRNLWSNWIHMTFLFADVNARARFDCLRWNNQEGFDPERALLTLAALKLSYQSSSGLVLGLRTGQGRVNHRKAFIVQQSKAHFLCASLCKLRFTLSWATFKLFFFFLNKSRPIFVPLNCFCYNLINVHLFINSTMSS